jgi:hypothetical protein
MKRVPTSGIREGWRRFMQYRNTLDPDSASAKRFRAWSKARLAHLAAIESKIGQEVPPDVLG